jgi:hypothetical protein
MSSEEILDDWFKLDKRGKNESVSGRIKLKVQYGTFLVVFRLTKPFFRNSQGKKREKREEREEGKVGKEREGREEARENFQPEVRGFGKENRRQVSP